jgi:hypothetical protein
LLINTEKEREPDETKIEEKEKPQGRTRKSPKYSLKILPNSGGKSNHLPFEFVI